MKISSIVCDFSNAKKEDKVWSIENGQGTIIDINPFRILVKFPKIENDIFTIDGRRIHRDNKGCASFGKYPSLFWGEPELAELPLSKK